MSKPTASICPLCSPPRRLPAPRISRSSAAMRNPLPRSLNSRMAASRRRAIGDSVCSGGNQQIRVGAPIRSADAAAQLIELRQAVPVGAIHDDRVGVRDVEAVLDDRRRQQDVGLLRDEVHHHALQLVVVHLPVPDRHFRFGHEPRDQVPHRVDRLDAVVDEEHLPAALELRANRALDHRRVELHDLRLDRQPVARRRLDHRHVANADQRHVQRPRNRRRRHRQHVDLLPELLDLLLVRDAEALLFVDDEQAEVAEDDVLRQQPVRADDDVDLPGGEIGQRLLLFLLCPEAADHVDAHRESRRSAPCSVRRCWNASTVVGASNGDLLAVDHGLERRAHRDFGFSVADVAAEQPIHRRRRLHVARDVGDRALLVGRQLVLEDVGELLLPVRVRR